MSVPREDVFPFFSDARNLQLLTPPWLHFSIRLPVPMPIGVGTRIDYRIRLRGVPIPWQSEITCFEPPAVFVDEQRRGPYRQWVHTHRFLEEAGGTRLIDEVVFDMAARRLVGWLVARDLRTIFAFRQTALLERFGQPGPASPGRIEILEG